MNLLARFRTFFRRSFALRCVLGVVLAGALSLGATSVYAQAGGGAGAPAGFGTAWTQGTTGLDGCSGVTGCLFQVLGVMVTYIFSIITLFLSKVLVILTGVLIVFARYNAFNTAPVVTMGWVIIRDLVNVFFIVILMASAFMSIIGLGDRYGLHYKKVVPSLVVGAILVNFSRTLMLLAIDASQVVTMTFISAFEGTIAGNIFQAFGISRMTQLQTQAAQGGAQATQQALDVASIGIAYLLAIFMLVTAVAIVLLYVGYFIFRIIGLWLLIVISPAAFVASSLPGKFGSSMDALTGDFWDKFKTFLTGGPTIAFMLWLAFAVIQETSAQMAGATTCAPGAGAQNLMGFEIPASLQTEVFVNCMGTVPQLATFIVSASLLVIGFGAATKTVRQTGAIGDALVGMVNQQRKAWMSRLQRAPITVGKVAGRGVAAAGRGAFNLVDRKYGVSNAFGRGVAGGVGASSGFVGRAGGVVGSAMRVIPGVGAVAATGLAGAALSRRKGLLGADTKAMSERMGQLDQLPAADRARALRNMRGSTGLGSFLDDAVMGPTLLMRQHEELSKPEMRKEVLKQLEADKMAELESEAIKALPSGRTELNEGEKNVIKARAGALAQEQLRQEENERLSRLQAIATTSNDTPQADALKKEVENRMAYAEDKDYKARVKELLDDPSKMKDLDESVQKSGRFVAALFEQHGVSSNGSAPDEVRLERLREQIKDQKELLATVDLVAKQLAGGGKTVKEIEQSIRRKDVFGNQRMHSTSDGVALYSTKEEGAQKALREATSTNIGAAIAAALEAELPLKEMETLLEQQNAVFKGVGSMNREIANYLNTLPVKTYQDRSFLFKQLDLVMKQANNANLSTSQLAEIAKSVTSDFVDGYDGEGNTIRIPVPRDAETLFGDYNNRSKAEQKTIASFLRIPVQMEEDKDFALFMAGVRRVFPEQQETITVERDGKSVQIKRGGIRAITQVIHNSSTA
jgi:hypothetical protein